MNKNPFASAMCLCHTYKNFSIQEHLKKKKANTEQKLPTEKIVRRPYEINTAVYETLRFFHSYL